MPTKITIDLKDLENLLDEVSISSEIELCQDVIKITYNDNYDYPDKETELKCERIEHIHVWSIHPLVSNYKVCDECEENTYNNLTDDEKSQIDMLNTYNYKYEKTRQYEKYRCATKEAGEYKKTEWL